MELKQGHYAMLMILLMGFVSLMSTNEIHEPVNLGNPTECTVLELAESIIGKTKSESSIRYESLPLDDPKQRCPDITKAKKMLGWEPKIGFEKGINKTISFFKEKLAINRIN